MRDQKIAHINLSTSQIEKRSITEGLRHRYLGGRGIEAFLLYRHIPAGCDPCGPDNSLVVSAGFLGGTLAPSSGRAQMGAKSPLTGLLGSTNMGGFFAPEMRLAGFDHLIVTGRAASPIYLWVHDDEIEIRDAGFLWGKDTMETPALIRKAHDDEDIQVICIGIAGENLVRFANVLGGAKNAAGRTGMGCVMGSKNIKAIAVRGTNSLQIANPHAAIEYANATMQTIVKNPYITELSEFGTPFLQRDSDWMGRLRNRNFQYNQIPKGEMLYADNLKRFSSGMSACFGCPVHCRHRYTVPEGDGKDQYAEGPEWCTLGSLGGELDITRIEAVLNGNYLVNKFGIDSVEFGSMLAWVIDLYEKGLIAPEFVAGQKLEWGNDEVMYDMIEKVAKRQGLGDILAEGPLRAIKKLGKQSEYYNLHVKGMSCIHTDERPTPAMALGIATATRGADHLRSRPGPDATMLPQEKRNQLYGFAVPPKATSYEGSGKLIWWHELLYSICDCLGVCKFQTIFLSPSNICYDQYCRLVAVITGMQITPSEMMEIGERVCTLERLFNIREGATRQDDYPPEPYFSEPTPLGIRGFRDKVLDREKYETELDEYYAAHGWDRNGIPFADTLEKLGLEQELIEAE